MRTLYHELNVAFSDYRGGRYGTQPLKFDRNAIYSHDEPTIADYLEPFLTSLGRASISADTLLAPADTGSNAIIGAPAAWASGYDGSGWSVDILDSGVQTNHPFLAGKVVAEACFSTTSAAANATSVCPNGQPSQTGTEAGINCSTTVTGCDHGTHAAGVAAGRNYTGGPGYDGVARGAQIVAVQIYSRIDDAATCGGATPCIRAFSSDVVAAISYVNSIASSTSVAAVSLALADSALNAAACDANPMKAGIDALRSGGIATIVPAGNGGGSGLSAPACISSAVSVGATNADDTVASFSNRSSALGLFAPGVAIGASVPGSSFAAKSGTSTAATVAGAWAVLRQRRPSASASELLTLFRSTGLPIGGAGLGVPRSRLDAAVTATDPIATPTRTPTTTPTHIPTATPVSSAPAPHAVYVPLVQR